MISVQTPNRFDPRRAGLTLIELVMVLVILVALAGLLVPQVDFLRRSSDKGTASVTMKNVSENIQLYRTFDGSYPNNWDSLIEDGGTAIYSKLGSPGKYGTSTLTDSEAASFTKIGIDTLLDHDDTLAYRGQPGDSGQVPRTIASGETVVVVTDPDIVSSIYPGSVLDADNRVTDASDLYDIKLVAVGLGPNNEAVGKTMMSPPAYMGVDPLTTYNRYIAVFAVFEPKASGNAVDKRTQLKAVLDSAGDFLNQEIIEFNENQIE